MKTTPWQTFSALGHRPKISGEIPPRTEIEESRGNRVNFCENGNLHGFISDFPAAAARVYIFFQAQPENYLSRIPVLNINKNDL